MRKRFVVACVALSCAAPQQPAQKHATTVEERTYRPLAFGADANAPHQAVILGTDHKDGATLLPLPGAPATATVSGRKITVGPNRDGVLHVGAHAAAAFVAATALDKDVTDFTFSVTGGGDGAAPSSLIAAGFLAAMTGAPSDPAATLDGVIYPDGTIVTRTSEVTDLSAAYKRLTGAQLPAPVPVDDGDMALDATTLNALDDMYKRWQQRLAAEWSEILQLESAGRVPALIIHFRDGAKRYAEEAEQLQKHGRPAAAYARMHAAAVYAASANQIYDVLANVQSNKLDAALAVLVKVDHLEEQATATFATIGAVRPATLGAHLQMLAAFRAALRAWAFAGAANRSLASTKAYLQSLAGTDAATLGSDEVADAVVAQVGPTILFLAKASAEATLAAEQLALSSATDVAYACPVPRLERLAATVHAAGAAALAHVDAVIDPAAQGVDADYLVATAAAKAATIEGAPKRARATWGDASLPSAMLALAASELAQAHAAVLIAKHDSIGVQRDDARQIKAVAHDKVLARMLAAAERNARANARAARVATGAIPVQAKLAYQLATVAKNGNSADKVDAVAQFWAASQYAQTAVMLARCATYDSPQPAASARP